MKQRLVIPSYPLAGDLLHIGDKWFLISTIILTTDTHSPDLPPSSLSTLTVHITSIYFPKKLKKKLNGSY